MRTEIACVGLMGLLMAGGGLAAGIAVDEMSVRRLGDAFSGGAAATDDASSVWYNPAAITRLGRGQLSAGGVVIPHETRFNGRVEYVENGEPVSGRNKTWTGTELIPDVYMALPITDSLWFGAGVNSPWGTGTEFSRDWVGRYQSIESKLLTVNLLTVLGWQISDSVSLGAGLVTEYADGEIRKAVPLGEDGIFKGVGDDTAFGWMAGVYYQPSPDWQFGINYRSVIKHKLEGHMQVDVPAGFPIPSEKFGARLNFNIPETVSLSAIHEIVPGWQLKADATWTRWSRFDQLCFNPKQTGSLIDEAQIQIMDWHDSWRFALGTEYRVNPSWVVRAGVAYDDSPTPNHTATIDFAIGDYRALSVGATWEASQTLSVDMALQHTWTTRRNIHESVKVGDEVVVYADGEVVNRINSIGVGVRWLF